VVTAAAQSTAISGTHQIEVTSLASSGTLYTNSFAAGANTSFLSGGQTTGDIQIQVGGASGSTRDIAITQGSNDTLTTLAASINTQSTANGWGVTASVVSDANGSRLSLQSQASGTTGALAVAANSNTSLTFAAPVGGTNAALFIDNVPFSSSSNTVTGAIQGVTLTLLSQSVTPVQLTVGADTGQITSAVNNFVSAYNTVISTINSQYIVDPTGSIPAPPLEGDISLRSLQSSLLNDVSYAVGGNGGLVNLASMGINMNNDGTLTVGLTPSDSSNPTQGGQTFAQVLAASPATVQSFFQNAAGTGFANMFNADLTNLTSPTQGPLNVDLTQNQAEQADLTTTINNFQSQITLQTTALTAQYDSVNATLQQYPLLLQEITQTLGTLGSGTSGSGSLVSSGPTLTSGL
jgi:flagellar hook-associated protein 2